MLRQTELYHAQGCTVVSCTVGLKSGGNKDVRFVRGWKTATYSNCLTEHVSDENGLAILTGEVSDLIVVDLDRTGDSADGVDAWQHVCESKGYETTGPSVSTPSGGKHLYYSYRASIAAGLLDAKCRTHITLCANSGAKAVDVRGDGGIIIAPPTRYEKGSYMWKTPFNRSRLEAIPAWLIASLNRKRTTAVTVRRSLAATKYDDCRGAILLHGVQPDLEKELGMVGEPYLTGIRTHGCTFKFPHPQTCWCREKHDSNGYWADEYLDGTVIVRNHSSKCSNRILRLKLSKTLTSMLCDPKADDHYVEVFIKKECMEGRHWVYDDQQFLFHDGALWRPVSDTVARREMWKAVKKVCDNLEKATRDTEWHKKVMACRSHVDCVKARKSMTEAAHDVIGDETVAKRMDTDPHLLGCENGVLDIRTGLLSSSPDFMVSKSVGYEYFDDGNPFDEKTMEEVKSFLAQVYPLEAERRLFQQYAGYCLYGRQPSKFMLMLTDEREGNNSKVRLVVEHIVCVRGMPRPFRYTSDDLAELAGKQDAVVISEAVGNVGMRAMLEFQCRCGTITKRSVRAITDVQRGKGFHCEGCAKDNSEIQVMSPTGKYLLLVTGQHAKSDLTASDTIMLTVANEYRTVTWSGPFHSATSRYFILRWWDFDTHRQRVKRTKGDHASLAIRDGLVQDRLSRTETEYQRSVCIGDILAEKHFFTKHYRVARNASQYPEQAVALSPYLVGLWLGDGTTLEPEITTIDEEVLNYLRDWAQHNGCRVVRKGDGVTWRVNGDGDGNLFLRHLRALGLLGNKHIPNLYKHNSSEVRLQLLAGIIDTDGHVNGRGYTVAQCLKHETLMDDICEVARGLGFLVSRCSQVTSCKGRDFPSFRCNILGNTHTIPVMISRKQLSAPHSRCHNLTFDLAAM